MKHQSSISSVSCADRGERKWSVNHQLPTAEWFFLIFSAEWFFLIFSVGHLEHWAANGLKQWAM